MQRLIINEPKRVWHVPATPTGRGAYEWRWYTEDYLSSAYVFADRKRGPYCTMATNHHGYCWISSKAHDNVYDAAMEIPAYYVEYYRSKMNNPDNLFRKIDADNFQRALEFALSLGIPEGAFE